MSDTPPEGASAPVLLTLEMSQLRRFLVVLALMLVAAGLVNAGVMREGVDPVSRVVIAIVALVAVVTAWQVWTATAISIELTENGLRQSDGRQICSFDEVADISRGLAVTRPANGFALLLRERRPFAWVPGLWWRMGRKVGVGGMTSKMRTRMMAEAIEGLLARRMMLAAERRAEDEAPPG